MPAGSPQLQRLKMLHTESQISDTLASDLAPPPLYLLAVSSITFPLFKLESVDPEPTNSLASQLRTEPRNRTCWSAAAFLSAYEVPSEVNPASELRVAQSVTVIDAVCVEPERAAGMCGE
ncbi:hypothetical protein MHYP_G00277970 [Metynnis hypsauchen]